MSVKVMGLVWDLDQLTSIQKIVLLALADHATHEGKKIFPGEALLIQKTSLSARTVREAKAQLATEDLDLLRIVQKSARGRPTEYEINMAHLKILAANADKRRELEARGASDDDEDLEPIETPTGAGSAATEARGAATEARGSTSKAPLTIINHHEPSVKDKDAAALRATPRANAAQTQQNRVRTILEKQGHHPELGYIGGYGGSILDQGRVDVSNFPEPYRIVLERFCRLWRIEPPVKIGSKSGAFGDWIVSARELMTAYGEYGPELLDVVYWSGDWLKADGSPMTIGRPGAILKWVSGWCGSLRQRGTKPNQLGAVVESLMPQFEKKASKDVVNASQNLSEDRKRIEQEARARVTKNDRVA